MKCGAWIWNKITETGVKPVFIAQRYVGDINGLFWETSEEEAINLARTHFRRTAFVGAPMLCPGTVIIKVSISQSPHWSGEGQTDCEIEIDYKCKRCGCTSYVDLPRDASGLSEYLTKHLERPHDPNS